MQEKWVNKPNWVVLLQWKCKEMLSRGKIVFNVNFNAIVPVSFSHILLEIWSLVFRSSAFVFQSMRRNLQRCEINHQSQHDNFCWPLHTWCILVTASFLPHLCPALDTTSCFLSFSSCKPKNHKSPCSKQLCYWLHSHLFLMSQSSVSALLLLSGGADLRLVVTRQWFLRNVNSVSRCWSP